MSRISAMGAYCTYPGRSTDYNIVLMVTNSPTPSQREELQDRK